MEMAVATWGVPPLPTWVTCRARAVSRASA